MTQLARLAAVETEADIMDRQVKKPRKKLPSVLRAAFAFAVVMAFSGFALLHGNDQWASGCSIGCSIGIASFMWLPSL